MARSLAVAAAPASKVVLTAPGQKEAVEGPLRSLPRWDRVGVHFLPQGATDVREGHP